MKLIIDIPEEMYSNILTVGAWYIVDVPILGEAIMKGIPLEDIETEILEKMADYVASGFADSAEDFDEYSRIVSQTFTKHIGGKK